jgi:hypothetical protein
MQLDFSNKPILRRAYKMAEAEHGYSYRALTNQPYIEYLVDVAEILLKHGVFQEDMLSAALLSDILRSGKVGIQEVGELSPKVLKMVLALSRWPMEIYNSGKRDVGDVRLKKSTPDTQTVECARMLVVIPEYVNFADPLVALDYITTAKRQLDLLSSAKLNILAGVRARCEKALGGLAALSLENDQLAEQTAAQKVADFKAAQWEADIDALSECAMF